MFRRVAVSAVDRSETAVPEHADHGIGDRELVVSIACRILNHANVIRICSDRIPEDDGVGNGVGCGGMVLREETAALLGCRVPHDRQVVEVGMISGTGTGVGDCAAVSGTVSIEGGVGDPGAVFSPGFIGVVSVGIPDTHGSARAVCPGCLVVSKDVVQDRDNTGIIINRTTVYSLVFAEIGIRDRSSTAQGLSNGTAVALYRVVFREGGITDFKDRFAFHLDCATGIVRVVPGEGRAINHQFGVRAFQPDRTGVTTIRSFTADRIVLRKLAAGDRDNGCSADRDRTAACTVSGCIGIVFQEVGIRDRIFRACAAIDEERTARSVARTGTESVSFKLGITDMELHIPQPHSCTTDIVTDHGSVMHNIAVVHIQHAAGLPNRSTASICIT